MNLILLKLVKYQVRISNGFISKHMICYDILAISALVSLTNDM